METLIKLALLQAFEKVTESIPQTKKETVFVNIEDVKPIDLTDFMTDNNIPENAYFCGKDNGYDGWECNSYLCYTVDVPTTEKDKLTFKKKQFNSRAFKCVFDILTINGYYRTGFNSGLLKEFDDTTVFDMYINKDFDRLTKYYSLHFELR